MSRATVSRGLLGAAALLLVLGAAIHAAAFAKVGPRFDAAELSPFLIGAAEALWLADSSNLFVLGAALGLVAARPGLANPLVVALLAAAPLASAALIYHFVGSFFAGHLMLGAAVLMLASALLRRAERECSTGALRRGLEESATRA
ncbi:MAG TPA: hypothetical protein VF079_11510 [Sphingomicrobium sp.]